ncbi:dihydrodiol dehydrogenase [Mycobacterium sp. E2238]|nr:dihydrodiol dehydrogenase [Mycobacterium sp. E2238]
MVRWSLEAGIPQHLCRRVRLADAESGSVPVNEPIVVANEFAEVEVRREDTRNGSRLLISAPRTGRSISLDALELEALTWQNSRTLEAMVGNSHAPLLPDEAEECDDRLA